ncbi:beta-microseminoprotein J1-like [Trichosurus vulpecula]|uniref:beta-microseminoprotein J1-like n=1 Tax=Trichosurus vulpecula TaxID=9337 RepID=UPI00186B133E|nr:beta-microseminoprotein J1-like [Trichosurus vulpecula]
MVLGPTRPSKNIIQHILLALALFVTLCDAQCTFKPLEISPGHGPKGCRDSKGVMHDFDTRWQSNCVSCSCDARFGLSCCSTVIKPMGYDTFKCVEIFNRQSCRIIAVQKVNPAADCEAVLYQGR